MAKVRKQPHEQGGKLNICGARTRKGTLCRNPQGFRTPHFGQGRCYLHGGLSTGPPAGNKNAVKTGEYEAIWFDVLEPEEQRLYHEIDTDKLRQVNLEIRLLEIRERRMLRRIENLREVEFTVVETETTAGIEKGKETDLTLEKKRGTLGQIQEVEEALTRVQAQKARLIEIKHKLESDQPPHTGDIQGYVAALSEAAAEVWDDDTNEEGTADEV